MIDGIAASNFSFFHAVFGATFWVRSIIILILKMSKMGSDKLNNMIKTTKTARNGRISSD